MRNIWSYNLGNVKICRKMCAVLTEDDVETKNCDLRAKDVKKNIIQNKLSFEIYKNVFLKMRLLHANNFVLDLKNIVFKRFAKRKLHSDLRRIKDGIFQILWKRCIGVIKK